MSDRYAALGIHPFALTLTSGGEEYQGRITLSSPFCSLRPGPRSVLRINVSTDVNFCVRRCGANDNTSCAPYLEPVYKQMCKDYLPQVQAEKTAAMTYFAWQVTTI